MIREILFNCLPIVISREVVEVTEIEPIGNIARYSVGKINSVSVFGISISLSLSYWLLPDDFRRVVKREASI